MSTAGNTNKEPLLILVHGTFAANESSTGSSWWQEGSDSWKLLSERLEPEIDVPDAEDAEIFHWSGANGARERQKGGLLLLKKMVELEQEGRPYHLIGHSHGGSVIWVALQLAVERRWTSGKLGKIPALGDEGHEKVPGQLDEELKLNHLRSWSTLGTPFIQIEASKIGNWYGKFVTTVAFIVSVVAMFSILGMLGDRLFEQIAPEAHADFSESLDEMGESGEAATKKALKIEPVAEATPVVPDSDSETTTSAPLETSASLFKSSVQWTIFSVLGGLAALGVFAIYTALRAKRVEAMVVRRENKAKHQAMIEFGERWLGLWSTEDEAINGLQATLILPDQLYGEGQNAKRLEIFPRASIPRQRIFESDAVVKYYRLFFRLLVPLHNRVVAPQGDNVLWSVVTKKSHGLDRPGCRVVAITEAPVRVDGFNVNEHLHLPTEIDRKLIDAANENIRLKGGELFRQARTALSNYTGGGTKGAPLFNKSEDSGLTSSELVHNSYYNEERIIDLLCEHITSSEPGQNTREKFHARQAPLLAANTEPDYNEESVKSDREWLKGFKDGVKNKILTNKRLAKVALPNLGKPNHLSWIAGILWLGFLWALLVTLINSDLLIWAFLLGGVSWVTGVVLGCVALASANRGAKRGWLARWIVEWSLVLPMGIVAGIGILWLIYV